MQERLTSSEGGWTEKETQWESQRQALQERLDDLTHQNDLLHAEAKKVYIDVAFIKAAFIGSNLMGLK